jgi:putative transposase
VAKHLGRSQRRLTHTQQVSHRESRVRTAIASRTAPEADQRKHRAEKTTTTDLARHLDVIGVEDLNIADLTRPARGPVGKAGRNVRLMASLSQGILAGVGGALATSLEPNGTCPVEKVIPGYTSPTRNACRHIARESRTKQAEIKRAACEHHDSPDLFEAPNIATRAATAVPAVAARGDIAMKARSVKGEPQLVASSAAVGILAIHGPGGCQRRNNAERAARSSSGAGATPRTRVTRTPMVTAVVVRMDGETARTVSPDGSEKYISTMTRT